MKRYFSLLFYKTIIFNIFIILYFNSFCIFPFCFSNTCGFNSTQPPTRWLHLLLPLPLLLLVCYNYFLLRSNFLLVSIPRHSRDRDRDTPTPTNETCSSPGEGTPSPSSPRNGPWWKPRASSYTVAAAFFQPLFYAASSSSQDAIKVTQDALGSVWKMASCVFFSSFFNFYVLLFRNQHKPQLFPRTWPTNLEIYLLQKMYLLKYQSLQKHLLNGLLQSFMKHQNLLLRLQMMNHHVFYSNLGFVYNF